MIRKTGGRLCRGGRAQTMELARVLFCPGFLSVGTYAKAGAFHSRDKAMQGKVGLFDLLG